jgi:hypothetical protein
MIPFVVVKTKAGFAYLRPEHVVAINASDSEDCTILMTDGVMIAAAEAAEDVVARLEAESREEDEAVLNQEHIHGHVHQRD